MGSYRTQRKNAERSNYSFKGNQNRSDFAPLNSGVRPHKMRFVAELASALSFIFLASFVILFVVGANDSSIAFGVVFYFLGLVLGVVAVFCAYKSDSSRFVRFFSIGVTASYIALVLGGLVALATGGPPQLD